MRHARLRYQRNASVLHASEHPNMMNGGAMFNGVADLRLDHVGVQVRDLRTAIDAFTKFFGYRQATEAIVNTRHGVEVVFLEKTGSMPLKLICPVGQDAPGATKLHHLAFRTEDIERAVQALREQGARVLSPPAPGEAFDDEPIAFLFAGGLNIELVSTDRRRGRLLPRE